MIVTNQRVFFRVLYQSQKRIQTFRLNVTAVASWSNPGSCDPNEPFLITGILELQTSYFDILTRTNHRMPVKLCASHYDYPKRTTSADTKEGA